MADDAPRWLDADEQRAWILVSQMTMRLPSALESRMQAVAGLGYFEYLVLSGLSMAPGRRLHLKDVARYTAARCRGCRTPSAASRNAAGRGARPTPRTAAPRTGC